MIGAAGFGREVLDVIDAARASGATMPRLSGVLDDDPSEADQNRLRRRGVAYLGSISDWLLDRPDGAKFVVAIGDPTVRRRLSERCEQHGREALAMALVHPSATFGFGVAYGPGTVVCAGVRVSSEVRLGCHAHLNPNAAVGHDTVIGDYVSVNPGAVVSGACHLEEQVLIGAGAVVLQGRRVGSGAVVGAAACVTRDVRPDTTVVGIPAR